MLFARNNEYLIQRIPRDSHNGHVVIDFQNDIESFPYSQSASQSTVINKSGVLFWLFDAMKIQLTKRSGRTSVTIVALLCLVFYVFYLRSSDISLDDIHLDKAEIRQMEMELDDPDRIQVVTYKPLSYEGKKHHESEENIKHPEIRGALAPVIDDRQEEVIKYHKIWAWANAAINIHELFPDTPDVELVLDALATAPIVNVDVLDIGKYESGTSEKWLVTLEGGQKALVKLAWEEKTLMKENAFCNYGYEMPWSEVASFHLHRVLGFRNTPYVVGRKIHLANEVVPSASPAVTKQISIKNNLTCITGKCYHCKESTTLCPEDGYVTASFAYWVPRHLQLYTYPPKYMPFSTPTMDEWEKVGFNNRTYCERVRQEEPYNMDRYYHDLFDFAVVDAISYHFDSKHYIVHDDSDAHGLTVRLDHGRAFCATDRDDEHIFLAPIFQCCTLRWETWWNIQGLINGALRRELKQHCAKDLTWGNLLHEEHYTAMERRLQKVTSLLERCIEANALENVFVG